MPVASVDDRLQRAEAVFTGTLVDVTGLPAKGEDFGTTDPVTYSFDVDHVYQGRVGRRADVTTALSSASCGLEGLEVGTRYAVFASSPRDYAEMWSIEGAALGSDMCSGTRPASDAYAAKVAAEAGPGHAPRQGDDAASTGLPTPQDDHGPVVALALGLLAVAGGAVLVWVLARRRRPTALSTLAMSRRPVRHT